MAPLLSVCHCMSPYVCAWNRHAEISGVDKDGMESTHQYRLDLSVNNSERDKMGQHSWGHCKLCVFLLTEGPCGYSR